MPPKKRKAASEAVLADSKKVKFDDETKTTLDSGRPKRGSAGKPNYTLTRPRLTAGPTAGVKAQPLSKTTPSDNVNGDKPKRGRGRPPKHPRNIDEPASSVKPAAKLTKNGKRVGRPPKRQSTSEAKPLLSAPSSARLTIHQAVKAGQKVTQDLVTPPPRMRSAAPPPSTARGRGRPPKGTKPTTVLDVIEEVEEEDEPISEASPARDSRDWSEDSEGAHYEIDTSGNLLYADDEDDEVEGQQYWLMKAEPESRIVNGVDVKFSIDDLMAAEAPEPWVSDNNL